jgi:hypothetical protein
MRSTRDTFTHFLADNLAPYSITVKQIRLDANSPGQEILQANAVNVQFLNPEFTTQISSQLVAIDIVHEDELTALDWTQKTANLLLSAGYTPKLDYTIPASPVALGTNIFWNLTARFTPVTDGNYARFSAVVELSHKL